ncbi:hypothetical protein ACFY0A_22865 [Streptomyces sp. NPDC001698]|uniref:hypothetical protein n=1 Tax=unclassified Streptomyces TaxID=2593676 RepID=UPI0036CD3C1F
MTPDLATAGRPDERRPREWNNGREGQILRRTLPLTFVTTALVGLPLFLLARTSG